MSDTKRSQVERQEPAGGDLDNGDRAGLVRDVGPVVGHDVLIARPELGADVYTLVVAGHRVPVELADAPRRKAPPRQ